MKLYGSTTSPYVRRLRIFLALHKLDYQFELVNIFGNEREQIKKVNPTLKVPMLETDNAVMLTDSGIAHRFLRNQLSLNELSFEEQNMLAHIDACNDSLVNLMILTRSGVDTSQDKLYFNIQRERLATLFGFFEDYIEAGKLVNWDYVEISMLVLIEWAMFRNLFDFSSYPTLLAFVEQSQEQPGVAETKPHE